MSASHSIDAGEVELLEAAAWASLHGAFAELTGGRDAAVRRWGRATALAARTVKIAAVNRAIGFGFDRALDEETLAELAQFYRDQGKSRWFLERSPAAAIADGTLEAAAGEVGGTGIKLVGDLRSI